MMVLVTGAAGKTGRAVIQALVKRGAAVRALVRREEQRRPVEALGAQETICGDMGDPAVLQRAAEGIRAVYHICPNVSPDEVAIGQAAMAAARAAGVAHFVYHSVLHPQTEAMPHHWLKLRVEELLLASGLPFTILQPAAYMQNVLAGWPAVVEQGIYRVPYPVETRLSMVDLEDVAEAAGAVLTEAGHAGATYELVGSEPLSQVEVAEVLSRALGRLVQAEQTPIEIWQGEAVAGGMGAYQVETLVKMFAYYERYGFWGNSNALGWLLGRRPASFAEFVGKVVETSGRF
ncbi:MAG: NmrA family NAD(P)-binding protein [Chloroflexi bacterium]|nr:NmrA family NAD(P)-binding protein [Chloroflexota bacterium]MCI0575530.1 NmrA family NAD(P)-binding protein [Chloroflexota bacterium]MCI0644307.1 NmrA family NAD(P)-binding protein [Chloroflexota bacterium]MCI0726290.1 NmrA family NAD(P)-binding protein [Chloroflexota bacterium]